MKLTTKRYFLKNLLNFNSYYDIFSDNQLYGYPMSNFCRENNYSLSYNSREVACHSIESYIERLQTGYHWELKIHAYRAVIEKLILRKWPNMIHSPLANVKYTQDLTFAMYVVDEFKARADQVEFLYEMI